MTGAALKTPGSNTRSRATVITVFITMPRDGLAYVSPPEDEGDHEGQPCQRGHGTKHSVPTSGQDHAITLRCRIAYYVYHAYDPRDHGFYQGL